MNIASLRITPRRNPRRFCNFHTLVSPAFATHRPASTYALFTKHPGVCPQFHPTTEDQNETATQHFVRDRSRGDLRMDVMNAE
jgi:hypothetical protein